MAAAAQARGAAARPAVGQPKPPIAAVIAARVWWAFRQVWDATPAARFRGGVIAAFGAALIAGYERHFPLSEIERAHFATLASGACIRFALSRAWDWLNTPPDALVMRKDPLAYMRRLHHYDPALATRAA